MNKTSKYTLIFMFVALAISVACLIGKFSYVPKEVEVSAREGSVDTVYIGSETDMKDLLNNYSNSDIRQNWNIVLTKDLDMKDYVVEGTLGSELYPFMGSFDGQGYTISNLTVDLSSDILDSTNKYLGLFGVTDGAEIRNLALSGTTTFNVGKCTNVYAGAVVATAKNNTTFQYIQNTAKVSFTTGAFMHNVTFGAFAGQLLDCQSVDSVISRTSKIDDISLNNNNNYEYNIGGFVGYLNNSSVRFGVVSSQIKVGLTNDFRGNVNIGGFAGKVQQQASKIINCIVENNFDIDKSLVYPSVVVNVGEVVGAIEEQVPIAGNIRFIYFKTNSTYDRFASQGNYEFDPADNIVSISSVPKTEEDFQSKDWDDLLGGWKFDTIWYMRSEVVCLQCCYGDYRLSLGNNLTSAKIVGVKQEFEEVYRYGQSAEIVFNFVDVEDGDTVVNMKDYYSLSALRKDNLSDVATFNMKDNGEYYFLDTETYNLSVVNGNFVVTIKKINYSTMGVYDINVEEKTFDLNVTSKLFSDEGNLEEGVIPAYVRQNDGQDKTVLPIEMHYGKTVTLYSKIQNSKSPYSFVGWYLAVDGGDDIELLRTGSGAGNALEVVFGRGYFTDNCSIYAKYQDDACIVTFILDEGVKQVGLFSGDILIKNTNESVSLSKTESSMKLEIYINDGYVFNPTDFIAALDTYKSSDTTKDFCVWSNEDSDGTYYLFTLDMTTLTGDFAEKFNVTVSTGKVESSNNNFVWYIVGGVGGFIVIVGVIVLIVVLKKRNGFGGGKMGGGSFGKKSYKGMYY